MNNDYKIQGDEVIIYFKRPNGEEIEILIDTVDLDTVKSFPNTWCVINSKGKYIVRGTITEEKKKRQVILKQHILKETLKDKKAIVYNIDGNGLDNRRCNLATNYEPEKLKRQNEYEVKGDIAILHLNRRESENLKAIIDREDLEKVLSYGTWIAEWHNDLKNFLVQNVTYIIENGKKRRVKKSLHKVLLNAPNGNIVRHKNGDTLDNRKENIILYKDDITNDYEIRGGVTAIFLEKVDGTRIETLIDTGDLEKVKKLGYTLHVSKGNGLPYVVGKVNRKNVFLHRYIVDAKGELQVDHINHNTFDNRRCNLNIVSRELNQQNRKGARKNSRSGVRGVSWDERNKDWIVVVRGIYFGRFKDLEKAKKLAEEKVEELMPYAINKEV